MGLGDCLFWTPIFRDLYNEVNNLTNYEEKLKRIAKYNKNYKKILNDNTKNEKYGVIKCKSLNKHDNFKIMLTKGSVPIDLSIHNPSIIFKNNPYLTVDFNYPNIIYLEINHVGYLVRQGGNIINILDDEHVSMKYAKTIGLKKYDIKPEIYITEEEKIKVKKYLPKEEFILVQPENHKIGRSYPFDKMQKIIDTFKDKILFVQISPENYAGKKSKFLNNVISFKDIFSYRETLYFLSHAKLCLLPHGGLSVGVACFNKKSIVIYAGLFSTVMGSYQNEIVIKCSDDKHRCMKINRGCEICDKFFNEHDENIIINEIKKNL